MPEAQRAFFQNYCVSCHNADKQKGQVRLDDIPFRIADIPTADLWQKVLGALNSGDMPPEDEKQPKPEEKLAFLEALSKQMVVAREALADSGGAITMRRLNRREYVNTMRDLLDVEVNPFDLPSDESTGAFDTFGSGLFFSSDQFELYLKLARAALDDAIVTGPEVPRKRERIECEDAANKQVRADYERVRASLRQITEWRKSGRPASEFGFGDDTNARSKESAATSEEMKILHYLNDPLSQTGALKPYSAFPQSITISRDAPPGRYIIRMRLAYPDVMQNGRRFVEFGTPGNNGFGFPAEMRLLGCYPVSGTPEKPDVLEIMVNVTRSGTRQFAVRERRYNTSEGADQKQYFRTLGVPLDARQRRPATPMPKLWIDWMEWEGPFTDSWPPRSHRAVFGDIALGEKPGAVEARQVIEAFAARAFRGRPVRPAFMDSLVGHFEDRTKAGELFFQAIKTPLAIVLASPGFLYLLEPTERDPGATPERSPQALVLPDRPATASKGGGGATAAGRVPLTNAELANRLSYFLWAGPPDERLMTYVAAGRLADRNVLSRGFVNEVDRMLEDPRSERFVAGFAHQWLHMTRLDFFQFNARLYPKFDASLRASARREVYETIRTVLNEDLPLGTLLKSDFVVADDLLVDYYGLGEMRGSAFRKVSVPAGAPRGGFLGMAAILAMGSDGERSSPVERGAWVMRKLLNDPPPPAPANVPQLSRFGDKLMPARELLLAHQEQPQCAQCHRHIDPIGFALQNFDAAGLWRNQEYAEFFTFWKSVQKKEIFPIDGSGRLPSGVEFKDFFSLRDAVAAHEEDFVRGLIEHLIEYALGRPGGFSDQALVESILKTAKASDMTLRSIIHGIVESREFHTK